MKEQLPTLDFEGTLFFFDLQNKELRQVTKPSNCIRFAEMEADDDLYSFYYNTRSKKLYKTDEKDEAMLPSHIRIVLLEREVIMGNISPRLVQVIPLVDSAKKFNDMQKSYLKNVRVKAKDKIKRKI